MAVDSGAALTSPEAAKVFQEFLWQFEVALLASEPGELVPAAPTGLDSFLQAECDALLRLLRPAREGDVAALLADPWLAPFGATLKRGAAEASLSSGRLAQLRAELNTTCAEFCSAASPNVAGARGLGIMLLAIAALQLYLRANWTGPLPEDDPEGILPFNPAALAEATTAGSELLDALEVDGEPVYELMCSTGYLWLASALLGILPCDSETQSENISPSSEIRTAQGQTLVLWRGRCAFAWQLSLAEASDRGVGQSPWLFKLSLCDIAGTTEETGPLVGLLINESLAAVQATTMPVLKTWQQTKTSLRKAKAMTPPTVLMPESQQEPITNTPIDNNNWMNFFVQLGVPPAVRAALIIEVGARLCWYGRFKPFDSMLDEACKTLGFAYEVTGMLGIKRQYQTDQIAQMVVKTRTTGRKVAAKTNDEASNSSDVHGAEGQAPPNLQLASIDDMTDILEIPKLSDAVDDDDRAALETPLDAVEQIVLLAKCHHLWASSNPNDELLLHEINALAQRVLVTEEKPIETSAEDGPRFTANWLIFSCGLWYRCRAEHHRNKTRERATFQLQSLVDQFNDKHPSVGHRLSHIHSTGYPARFHLQHELGVRMMKMGMVSTAHEEFKKLRMWPQAIDCLMVAERNVEALDLVKDLLEKTPSPRLWCCLGDLERDPKHYEKAWKVSGCRFARAQRSLGRHYFAKKELDKAIDAFTLAVGINPLHAGIWFTMGVAQMQLERWEDAASTFVRCLGIDDENSEAWGNLAATHSARGNMKEARNCMFEATRRSWQNWKMWDSFLGICMQLRDIQGCIQGMSRLVDLEQASRIEQRVLGMLTAAVVNDMEGLYENRTGRSFLNALTDFFKTLTSKHASEPCYWHFYAELQDVRGEHVEALESRLKQCRAAQARLWEERDPTNFNVQLEDLRDCFDVIAETFADPCLKEQAQQQMQPFAYSVRDAAQRLQAKLDSAVQQPEEWITTCRNFGSLATRLETQAATIGSCSAQN